MINKDSYSNGFDQITIQNKKEIVARIVTDKNGLVTFSKDIIKDFIDYDLFLTSIGVSGTYLTTINYKTKFVEICLPKKYNIRLGKAVCPKCEKTNKVIKVSYSGTPVLVKKIINGDTIISPIYKDRYYMGTDVTNNLNPLWYCQRDSLLF
ncbi:MAG: hypothetical protein WCK02_15830 [Bacteroidota bacterium]